MYHYIYKTTLLETGEYYIGKHSTEDLSDGYYGSGVLLVPKIKAGAKYEVTILEMFDDEESCYLAEESYIGSKYKSDSKCLNKVKGGRRGMADVLRGIPKTEEWKQKISIASSKPKDGKALEATLTNAKKATDAWSGCSHSEETKKQISRKNKEYWGKQKKRPWQRFATFLIEGVEYVGYESVYEVYGVGRQTVTNRCKNEKFPDWIRIK